MRGLGSIRQTMAGAALLVASVSASEVRSDVLIACAPGAEHYGVGAVHLCVPTDETGYALLAEEKDAIRFKEQFFSNGARVTDTVGASLRLQNGAPVIAVFTTVLDRHDTNSWHAALGQKLVQNMAALRQNETTALTVAFPEQGPTPVTVRRLGEREFFGSTEVAGRYRYWLIKLDDASLDYIVGCEPPEPGKTRFFCDGELRLEKVSAAVLLVGDVLDEVPLAFEGNRDIVRTFVVP
jgi:hypothetical protein